MSETRYHHGANKANLRFHQAYPLFKDGILGPMKDFAGDVFDLKVPQTPKSAATDSAPLSPGSPIVTPSSPTSMTTNDVSSGPVAQMSPAPTASPSSAPSPSPFLTMTSSPPSTSPMAPTAPPSSVPLPFSFSTYVAQSTTPDSMIDPRLMVPEPGLNVHSGGYPYVSDGSSAEAQDAALSVGNKRQVVVVENESCEKENIPPGVVAEPALPVTKRRKLNSTAVTTAEAQSGAVPSARPSRANAGGIYKEVRDQVKVGGKAKGNGKVTGKGNGKAKAKAKGK